MKKNLPLILIILGVILFLGAAFLPWSGKFLKLGDRFVDRAGYAILFGQIAMGVAALSVPLAFYRRNLVALTGLIVIGLSAVTYVKPPEEGLEGWGPLYGLHVAMVAGGLIFIGGILPKRKR